MRSINDLKADADRELEQEKDQIAKEVIKDLLIRVNETEEAVEEAKRLHEDAKKKYSEVTSNYNLLMKLCLEKTHSHPISPK
jgi:hypothetical protein